MKVKSEYPQDVFKIVPMGTGSDTFAQTGSIIPKLTVIQVKVENARLNPWDGEIYLEILEECEGAKKGEFLRFQEGYLQDEVTRDPIELDSILNK